MTNPMISNYPSVANVYARSSLLEAGLHVDSLESPISVKDPSLAEKELTGRRAARAAKQWGPVILHNAIYDTAFPSNVGAKRVLEKLEGILEGVSDNHWYVAMHHAAGSNMALSRYINQLSRPEKSRLLADKRRWQEAAEAMERVIGSWVKEHGASIAKYLAERSSDSGISLKGLKKIGKKQAA